MKRILFTVISGSAIILAGCAEFPTSYSRIEPEKARLLDFIYEPAEAAPGDTVLCKAIFAGREVTAGELTWRMSRKIAVNEYGTAVAFDTVPLEIIPQEFGFSDRTSCIAFRFVVPENTIAESPSAPENLVDALPEYYRTQVPEEFRSITKSSLLEMVDLLSSSGGAAVPIDKNSAALLPMLLQCYSVPMRLYCTTRDNHTILSGYTVRYNSRFAAFPALGIPVNRNPRIDSIGIYKVCAAPLAAFDPSTSDHEFEYLAITDTNTATVIIDKGFSYFVSVITGDVDSSLSIDAAMGNGTKLPEQHHTAWYLEFDKVEMDKASAYDLATIDGDNYSSGRHIANLYPSSDTDISNCTVWIEVTDQFLNEYFRPQGSMLREIRLRFTYTDDYAQSLK